MRFFKAESLVSINIMAGLAVLEFYFTQALQGNSLVFYVWDLIHNPISKREARSWRLVSN